MSKLAINSHAVQIWYDPCSYADSSWLTLANNDSLTHALRNHILIKQLGLDCRFNFDFFEEPKTQFFLQYWHSLVAASELLGALVLRNELIAQGRMISLSRRTQRFMATPLPLLIPLIANEKYELEDWLRRQGMAMICVYARSLSSGLLERLKLLWPRTFDDVITEAPFNLQYALELAVNAIEAH